jgi:hypothetical protein
VLFSTVLQRLLEAASAPSTAYPATHQRSWGYGMAPKSYGKRQINWRVIDKARLEQ